MGDWSHVAGAGALLLGTLAVLHWRVWHAQGQRFSWMFASAFGLSALAYALDPWLRAGQQQPNALFTTLRAPAIALLTLGMVDYVGLAGAAARRFAVAVGIALCALLAAVWAGIATRPLVFGVYALALLGQAWLVAGALRREPGQGHALVLLALLGYLAAYVAALRGMVPVTALRYVLIAPVAVLGTTVLATGLLRTQRRLQQGLARAHAAEEALRTAQAGLERRVEERTADLNQMVLALESFNQTVSHDLRGPLGGIAGLARMAGTALEREDLPVVRRSLATIAAQADASVQLIAALLALARAGRGEFSPRPVDLDELLAVTLEQLRTADTQGTAWKVLQPDRLPVVEADPDLVRQVFVNLIGNAAKFSRGEAEPRIEIGVATGGGERIFYVRDNGVGFDAEQGTRLFEPFRRLHGRGFEGHGVGLSIVKRIVERHGGRVWAEGRPGEGATFRFTLSPPPA